MAEPITWRSINAPEPKDALMPMVYGARTIDNGFAALQKTLGMVTDNQEANWQNQKVNNTQALMDALKGAKTPEELAVLQTGALADMKAGMGSQFDMKAFSAAEDARPGILRDTLTKEQTFANDQNVMAHKPIGDAMQAALMKGDDAAFQQLATNFPGAPQLPAMMEMRRQLSRQNTTDAQNKQLHDNKLLEAPLDRAYKQAQTTAIPANTAIQQAGLDVNLAQARTQEARYEATRIKEESDAADRALKRAGEKASARSAAKLKNLKDNGSLYGDGIYTPEKVEDLEKVLKTRPDLEPEQRNAMMGRLSKFGGEMEVPIDPKDPSKGTAKVPIPLSIIKESLAAASFDKGFMKFNKNGMFTTRTEAYAEDFEDRIRRAMTATYIGKDADGKDVQRNKMVDDYTEFTRALNEASDNPVAQKKSR